MRKAIELKPQLYPMPAAFVRMPLGRVFSAKDLSTPKPHPDDYKRDDFFRGIPRSRSFWKDCAHKLAVLAHGFVHVNSIHQHVNAKLRKYRGKDVRVPRIQNWMLGKDHPDFETMQIIDKAYFDLIKKGKAPYVKVPARPFPLELHHKLHVILISCQGYQYDACSESCATYREFDAWYWGKSSPGYRDLTWIDRMYIKAFDIIVKWEWYENTNPNEFYKRHLLEQSPLLWSEVYDEEVPRSVQEM